MQVAGNRPIRVRYLRCIDGRSLTDDGRWMYPRAADLTSPDVQGYTDAEPFWILKNGIRLSGMPDSAKWKPPKVCGTLSITSGRLKQLDLSNFSCGWVSWMKEDRRARVNSEVIRHPVGRPDC